MKILSINCSIIKNGLIKKFSSVIIHNSVLTLSFLDVLFREGVIRSYVVLPSKKIEVYFVDAKSGRPLSGTGLVHGNEVIFVPNFRHALSMNENKHLQEL